MFPFIRQGPGFRQRLWDSGTNTRVAIGRSGRKKPGNAIVLPGTVAPVCRWLCSSQVAALPCEFGISKTMASAPLGPSISARFQVRMSSGARGRQCPAIFRRLSSSVVSLRVSATIRVALHVSATVDAQLISGAVESVGPFDRPRPLELSPSRFARWRDACSAAPHTVIDLCWQVGCRRCGCCMELATGGIVTASRRRATAGRLCIEQRIMQCAASMSERQARNKHNSCQQVCARQVPRFWHSHSHQVRFGRIRVCSCWAHLLALLSSAVSFASALVGQPLGLLAWRSRLLAAIATHPATTVQREVGAEQAWPGGER